MRKITKLQEWARKRIYEIVVVAICVLALGGMVAQKEGFHMDELLSFELANAQFNPWIVPTQPEGRLAKFVRNEIDGANLSETTENLVGVVKDVFQNRGESKLLSYKADVYEEPIWITREQFEDYITVDDDGFNYLSVYFNVKDDNHPPVHFMLLHTICSIFKGYVTPIMGCIINLAAVVGILILLMKSGNLLAQMLGMEQKAKWVGLLCALLYGLSTGAVTTTLLIRMYGVLTLLCVAFFYVSLCKWHKKEFTSHNKSLIAITVLGFWTQYFFLFYCILLVAVLVCLLWKEKRIKEMWIYIRSMVIAAVVGVGLFPFAISDVFSSGRGVEALQNLSQGLGGYGERLLAFGNILLERGLGWFAGLVLLLIVVGVIASKKVGKTFCNVASTVILLIVPVVGYFLLAARMSPYLVDRYIMPIFPFVMLITGVAITMAAIVIEKAWKQEIKGMLLCFCVLVIQLCNLLHYDGSYLYKGYQEQLEFAQEHSDSACICVYDGVGYYENLQEFACYDKTLLVKMDELRERKDTASLEELEKIVVLMKANVEWEQVVSIMQEQYQLTLIQDWSGNSVYGDKILVFAAEN